MAFTIFARAPLEKGMRVPSSEFETHKFKDTARYKILPSGVLVVDDGEGTCWVLAANRWQWVRGDPPTD
jgi:hypothetical protein